MDLKVKQQWLAALRGNHYKQGHHMLRTPDGRFCCLGVLCDLVDPGGWSEKTYSGTMMPMEYYHHESSYFPVAAFLESIGVGRETANTITKLADANDAGKTFAEIADMIERAL